MTDSIISVRGLHKTYRSRGGDIQALSGVTFDVGSGECLTVLGPSGCGKSTLLKILAGLLDATSGEVLFRNEPIRGPEQGIGVVFQDPVLMPWRNVLSNVMLPVEVLHLDRKTHLETALSLLDMVGLYGFRDRYVWELSGGMQQRLAIARALVFAPSVLLMDEPFGALDAITREQMNVELLRISSRTRKTIFFITHNVSEAVYLGDRVVVLTPRPSTVATIVEVDLPSRDREVIHSDAFGYYVKMLDGHIKSQGITNGRS